MQVKVTLPGALCYGVKHYTYMQGRTYVDIQVLEFETGCCYGSQAMFRDNGKAISSGHVFETEGDALQDIVNLIEAELKARK